jgi:hypothetical protein
MAKPIQGTKQNDPVSVLMGTNGSDKLKGKDGNDVLKGGPGDDDIDGGAGIDTAVYSGSIGSYVISSHGPNGTGNNKITVSGGSDGNDTLKNVEWLQFDDGMVNVTNGARWHYLVNEAADATAEDPASPGNLYVGSGIPNENFGIARNEAAGVELGLQVIYRQGPSVASTDNYADGVLHFQVNDGPQSTVNGSIGNDPSRAAWSFEFSVATGLNGETTDLGDFTFQLLYDVDPGLGTNYRTLTLEAEAGPQAAGQSGYQWRDQGTGLVFIADDEGTANVTQNSENYTFAFFQNFLTSAYGPGNNFAGPAHFDIVLQALDNANVLIAQNHIMVDVI